jgi:regulator of protease activity HflC (stomatin/prohibitin superfamily)
MNVLSSNALDIKVEMAVTYKPSYSKLGFLHAEIGPDYKNRIVINKLRTTARTIFGKYTPEEMYSTKKELLQDEILKIIQVDSEEKYVAIESVSIRSIELPTKINDAIQRKLKQEQEAEEYKSKLVKAQKEAERQKIEAEGKAAANRIISASLTDKILKEKGIEATIKLSESPNSKVIVVGSGKDGLPLILGNN